MTQVQPRERGLSFFQLAPALIGLLGVLIGAAATSGVTYLGDHRRAKADERGAERLVLAEVLSDNALLRSAAPPDRLADAAWRAERERLARSLSNAEWAWVAKYYRDLVQAKSRIRTLGGIQRLEADESCTLAALNIWSYSDPQHFKGLRKNGTCKKPPGTV
jgi:hypothetical protein